MQYTIPLGYQDLHEVYRSTWYAQSFINIVHAGGKHMIPISCPPSAEAFHAILNRLQEGIAAHAGGQARSRSWQLNPGGASLSVSALRR